MHPTSEVALEINIGYCQLSTSFKCESMPPLPFDADGLMIIMYTLTLTIIGETRLNWARHAPQPVSRPRGCLQGVSTVSYRCSSECLIQVVNSLVGCRAKGGAPAERLVTDGGESGRDCDLSEGGAVLMKVGREF